jgi:alpha-tubulin suppressor-like RCC1 family protein
MKLVGGVVVTVLLAGCGEVWGIEGKECLPGCIDDKRRMVCDGDGPTGEVCDQSSFGRCYLGGCGRLSLSALGCTTCATKLDGSLWCWGSNHYGQLGDGGPFGAHGVTSPQRVPLDARAVDVSVGTTHVCAVTDMGSVYCWGWNVACQTCGDGDLVPEDFFAVTSPTLIPLPAGERARRVSSGAFHSCALTSNKVYCWGSYHVGQLGMKPELLYDGPGDEFRPVIDGKCGDVGEVLSQRKYITFSPQHISSLSGAVTDIVSQKNTTCALVEGNVRCWGANCAGGAGETAGELGLECEKGGQLGDSPDAVCFRWRPRRVFAPDEVIGKFSLGHIAGYAVQASSGQVYAWGWDDGQLGTGVPEKRFRSPTKVQSIAGGPLTRASDVVRSNGWHGLARVPEGWVGWGHNDCGELGSLQQRSREVTVERATLVEEVHADAIGLVSGQDHMCYRRLDGTVYCMGKLGHLGVGRGQPDNVCDMEQPCSDDEYQPEPQQVNLEP